MSLSALRLPWGRDLSPTGQINPWVLINRPARFAGVNCRCPTSFPDCVGKQEVRAEQRVVQEGSSPSGARMRGAISKKRGSQPRWPEKVEGMETSKRARRRKLDTAKTDLKPPLAVLRRAGCPSRDGIRRA